MSVHAVTFAAAVCCMQLAIGLGLYNIVSLSRTAAMVGYTMGMWRSSITNIMLRASQLTSVHMTIITYAIR